MLAQQFKLLFFHAHISSLAVLSLDNSKEAIYEKKCQCGEAKLLPWHITEAEQIEKIILIFFSSLGNNVAFTFK